MYFFFGILENPPARILTHSSANSKSVHQFHGGKLLASGDPNALEPRKRGPKTDTLSIEYAALQNRNQKLEEELKRAKIVIDVQKTLRPAGAADSGRAVGEMTLKQGVGGLIPHFGIKASCSLLNVPRASYNQWRAGRKSASVARRNVCSRPPRSLDDSEIKQVKETLNSERLVDQSPRAVYADLLDEEKNLSTWQTMYRIMSRSRQVGERRNQRGYPRQEKPQPVSTAPNQLWSCDITRFIGPSTGVCYQLYVIIDVYSRYITGWIIADRESADLATRFIPILSG